MKTLFISRKLRILVIFCTAFGVLAALPLLSGARSATSVNIVNNSSRAISHVYTSHVDADDWTGNLLGDESGIGAGQSYQLTNIACDQQQVKVIGEDQDGCFVSIAVACGESSTWTITNNTPKDCGAY
jgi:hypothetical protein